MRLYCAVGKPHLDARVARPLSGIPLTGLWRVASSRAAPPRRSARLGCHLEHDLPALVGGHAPLEGARSLLEREHGVDSPRAAAQDEEPLRTRSQRRASECCCSTIASAASCAIVCSLTAPCRPQQQLGGSTRDAPIHRLTPGRLRAVNLEAARARRDALFEAPGELAPFFGRARRRDRRASHPTLRGALTTVGPNVSGSGSGGSRPHDRSRRPGARRGAAPTGASSP
jgi:hypothetical protein